MKSIGVPKFVASGQHDDGQQKCRFMVMDRFGSDLQKIFEGNGKVFSMKIVCILALRVVSFYTEIGIARSLFIIMYPRMA